MKRILFTIALSLLFGFQLNAQDIYKDSEFIDRGELHYILNYTDSTKLELKHFRVVYKPKYYKKVSRKYNHYLYPSANRNEYLNFIDKVEILAIKHFGEEKVFNKDGLPNIIKFSFAVKCLTGEVYLRYIHFTKDVYNLVSDEEILSFAKEFNETLRITISNKEEYNKKSLMNIFNVSLFKF